METKTTGLERLIDFICAAMKPIVPIFISVGIIKSVTGIITVMGISDRTSIIISISDIIKGSVYAVIPILLSSVIAEMLGCNKMLSMVISSLYLYPTPRINTDGVFGIEAILAVFLIVPTVKYIEILFERILPKSFKTFFKPFAVLLVCAPLALLIFGPFTDFLGKSIIFFIKTVHSYSPLIARLILNVITPILTAVGLQNCLVAFDTSTANTVIFYCALSQAGICLAYAIRCGDRDVRQTSFGAGVVSLLSGLQESAVYAVTLKVKNALLFCWISTAFGVITSQLLNIPTINIQSPTIYSVAATIHSYDGYVIAKFLLSAILTFFTAFMLILVTYRRKKNNIESSKNSESITNSDVMIINSPVSGYISPLSQCKDAILASGTWGKGCLIDPTDGRIYSPFDGKIENLSERKNSITLRSSEGIIMLIHIGMEKVARPDNFTAYGQIHDNVHAGDLLIEFDHELISDISTPIIIINSQDYETVGVVCDRKVTACQPLFNIVRKPKKKLRAESEHE